MQKLALDTTAYTAYGKNNPTVTKLLDAATYLGLPIIVLGEIYFGAYNSHHRQKNEQVLNQFLESPRLEILHINELTAKLFGEISTELKRNGRPIQQNDVWIAALCKQYGYPLAASDKGFESITGLELRSF